MPGLNLPPSLPNCIAIKLRAVLAASLLVWLLPFTAISQIKEITDLTVPPAVLADYPFIENSFYYIKCPDSTGMEGYFVLTLNKEKLNAFISKKMNTYIDEQLRQNRLYKSECTIGINDCGDTHSDLDRFDLKTASGGSMVIGNSFIRTPHSMNLKARKTNTYRSRKWDWGWFCKRQKDRSVQSLLSASITTNLAFGYDANRFSFNMKSAAVGNANILFDGCALLLAGSPYYRRRSEPLSGNSNFNIYLGNFGTEEQGLLKVFLENTKRVNITEDKEKYYVYCIRTKV